MSVRESGGRRAECRVRKEDLRYRPGSLQHRDTVARWQRTISAFLAHRFVYGSGDSEHVQVPFAAVRLGNLPGVRSIILQRFRRAHRPGVTGVAPPGVAAKASDRPTQNRNSGSFGILVNAAGTSMQGVLPT